LKFTILLIDDEENIIRSLRRVFDDEDFEVLAALTPESALSILKSRKVDLILCDHMMPGMLGTDILKHARNIQPDAIRLLVTGSADMQVAITAINEGSIYYFFTKPWDNNEMLTVVRTTLRQKREQEEKNNLLSLMNASKDSLLEVTKKLDMLGDMIESNGTEKTTTVTTKKLLVQDDDTIIPLSISEVIYIAAVEDAVWITTKKGRYQSHEPLNALEAKLAYSSFFRCHRSYIVNIEEIDKITPWFNGAFNITLKGLNDNIPVSRNNAKRLKEIF
jgi:two-component system response regulator LytT